MQPSFSKSFHLVLFAVGFGLHSSCSKPDVAPKEVAFLPPVTVPAGDLIVVNPDTCPPPRIIPVSISSNLRLGGQSQADSVSQGTGLFKNFNADDGLVADGVSCTAIDRAGNLWIGTQGAGMSRFDGKSSANFTTSHGLPDNIVNCILEDTKGRIWIGTSLGLSRFNGKSFDRFSTADHLPGFGIDKIIEDEKGNIWIGTNGGIGIFDGNTFSNFSDAHDLPEIGISSLIEDSDKNLWFGTRRGLTKYDGHSFKQYTVDDGLINSSITCMAKDKKGNLWIGTAGGICRFDGKSFTSFSSVHELMSLSVKTIAVDRMGTIWFGTNNGVVGYDGKNLTHFTTDVGLASNIVNSITEDRTGNLWFGTYGGGLSCYQGKAFTHFPVIEGIRTNEIFSSFGDPSGNLWFGGTSGLSRFDGKVFSHYSASDPGLIDQIWSITKEKSGNLWLGSLGGGLIRFDGTNYTQYTTKQGLIGNGVISLTWDHNGDLWLGTFGGICRFDGKTFSKFQRGQIDSDFPVWRITSDSRGNIWLASKVGAICYDGKSFITFTMEQGLAHNNATTFVEDKKGNLWIGTYGGISRFDGQSFSNFTTRDGLPDNVVTQLDLDSLGRIIIGTNFGMAVIRCFTRLLPDESLPDTIPAQNNLNAGELKQYVPDIAVYHTRNGHPVTDVNFGDHTMRTDSKGIVWIGTGAARTGLVRFDPSAVLEDRTPPVVVLQSIKINNERICWYDIRRDGNETIDSISIHPNVLEESYYFGKVPLTDADRDIMYLRFKDIEFDSITPFYPLPANLKLPHSKNSITFEFNAIVLNRHSGVRYQYKLDHYDKDWSPVTDKDIAVYGNLRRGRYTFMVKACSPDEVWGEPVSYDFKVKPVWYLSYPALTLWVLMLAGFILLGFRIRLNQVRRHNQRFVLQLEQQIKERTAQLEAANKAKSEFLANMSHEIRTPLNAVLGYADLLAQSLENKTQKEYVESLKSSGRGLLTLINGILDLSKIEAGKLDLEFDYINTKTFFSEFERIFSMKISEKGLQFLLDISSGIPAGIYVDENRLRQIMFNLIGNAIKFTEKGQIKVSVSSQNHQFTNDAKDKIEGYLDLIVEIEDTGIGISQEFQKEIFDPFTQQSGQKKYGGTGLGLAISKRLIALMNGTIGLTSEINKGSCFRIVLPDIAFIRDFGSMPAEVQINIQDIEFNPASILIADDVESNRKYLIDALIHTNLKITEAEDGQTAYQLSEQIIPDLIITDIRMPGLTGFELLKALKANAKLDHIPVIAYSASVMKEEREKIHMSEFAGLLIKPVQISELFQVLMEHLPHKNHGKTLLVQSPEKAGLPSGIKELSELITNLEAGYMDTWNTFKVRQPINEILKFGKDLAELGKVHNAEFLSRFGTELAQAADSFNTEAILKLLKQYPGMIDDLKARMENN